MKLKTKIISNIKNIKEHGFFNSVKDSDKYVANLIEKYKLKEDEYTIEVEDITDQVDSEKKERADRKTERLEIKSFLQNVNDSDLPGWHKKILRRTIKDLRDD